MPKKDIFDCVNPERRTFVKKITTAAFVAPAVVSVTMMNQKLDLSTANAATGNQPPPPASVPGGRPPA